ncbi:MAG: S1 RNA-binding domain-containing protein [Pirellulaceae bacterium]|jgi:small subunit ribosomal protein S1|nr:S1 RNA-binding domain-containing protein [Pirellulaceae bacterium]
MNIDPNPTPADALSVTSPSSSSPAAVANQPVAAPALLPDTAASAVAAAADAGQADKPVAQSPAAPPLRRMVKDGPRMAGGDDRSGPPRSGGFRNRGGGPRPRRDRDEERTRDPLLDGVEAPDEKRAKVTPPSRRQPLPPDLEQEMAAAFAGASMEQLVSGAPGAAAVGTEIEVDTNLRGIVVKIHGDNVFFALDGHNEGVASLRQFSEPPQLGMELHVVVSRYHAEDGLYELRVPGSSIDVEDWSDLAEGAIVEARVTGSNVGGLECMVGHIRGFIPASQIEMFRVEHYPEYYDKKLLCVVTEANERRRNLILSHRALLEREKEEQRTKLLEELQVGDVREGTVTSVRDFGAFVDIGGLDGLVHISQLSWDRIAHPSEVLQAGQKIRVKVEKVNRETGKIGLNYRDLLDHPWTNVEARFPVESMVKGVVTRTAKFGAFVKLAPGIEGLIHISELAHHRVLQVTNVVHEGDEVEVKVLAVDAESQRISLSLKDAHPLPEPEASSPAEEQAADEPLRKPVVRPSGLPLKGGTGQEAGGDRFGLKW